MSKQFKEKGKGVINPGCDAVDTSMLVYATYEIDTMPRGSVGASARHSKANSPFR